MTDDGVAENELRKAKNRNETNRAKSIQQLAKRNDNLQQAYTYTRDTDSANKDLERLLQVETGDISALSQYLRPEASVALHTLPKAA